jgi:hypothetical protein
MSVKGQMSKEEYGLSMRTVLTFLRKASILEFATTLKCGQIWETLNFSAKSKIWEKFAEVQGCWCAYWTSNPRILRSLRMVGSIPTHLRQDIGNREQDTGDRKQGTVGELKSVDATNFRHVGIFPWPEKFGTGSSKI